MPAPVELVVLVLVGYFTEIQVACVILQSYVTEQQRNIAKLEFPTSYNHAEKRARQGAVRELTDSK